MDVRFASRDLARLEEDEGYDAGYSHEIVDLFRRRMQFIRAAADERDFYALKALHYEKLKGRRKHQRSMRLNKQFRLILEIRKESSRIVVVIDIEDYH